MKFSCGVTLFYPSINELESIIKYKESFERVYIFDNTEGQQANINSKYFRGRNDFVYISNQSNDGLSIAFNKMCERSIRDGNDFICLFDQDSVISKEDIAEIISFIKKNDSNTVGVYAPQIVYEHSNVQKKGKEEKFEYLNWVISSGSFINLSIFSEIGGFDENYFIDRIDYDYCLTVRKLGYEIVRINNVYLYQKLGEIKKIGSIKVAEHSPVRHYYMFRNRLYFLLRRNNRSVIQLSKAFILSIRHFLQVILLEKQKYKKIKMLIRGLKDFTINKMGKIQ